jgi:hypothetical protein
MPAGRQTYYYDASDVPQPGRFHIIFIPNRLGESEGRAPPEIAPNRAENGKKRGIPISIFSLILRSAIDRLDSGSRIHPNYQLDIDPRLCDG